MMGFSTTFGPEKDLIILCTSKVQFYAIAIFVIDRL